MSDRAKSQSGVNFEEEFEPDAAMVEFIENWKSEFWKNAPAEETCIRPISSMTLRASSRDASSS